MAQVTYNDIIANQTIRVAVLEAEKQELANVLGQLQAKLNAAEAEKKAEQGPQPVPEPAFGLAQDVTDSPQPPGMARDEYSE